MWLREIYFYNSSCNEIRCCLDCIKCNPRTCILNTCNLRIEYLEIILCKNHQMVFKKIGSFQNCLFNKFFFYIEIDILFSRYLFRVNFNRGFYSPLQTHVLTCAHKLTMHQCYQNPNPIPASPSLCPHELLDLVECHNEVFNCFRKGWNMEWDRMI